MDSLQGSEAEIETDAPKVETMPHDSAKLHDTFTNITLLVRLLTYLHPVYKSSFTPNRLATLEDHSVDVHPLEAIAAILVMKDEVIAACHTPQATTIIIANLSETDLNDPMSPVEQYHSIQVAALSDPQFQANTPGMSCGSNPHQLRALDMEKAVDFWPEVQKNRWHCAFQRKVTLGDHAKTLASYLNSYKNASHDDRDVYSNRFFPYLLSVCWRKMLSRISSWPAVGFIFELQNALKFGMMEQAINEFAWGTLPNERGPGDRALAHMLKDCREFIVESMKEFHCDAAHQSLRQLFSAVDAAIEDRQNYDIYKKSTALEFHCVLVASLLGFARTLALVESFQNDCAKLQTTLHSFWVYAHILKCILSSASFATHLKVIIFYSLPVVSRIVFYKRFASANDLKFISNEAKELPNGPGDLSDSEDYPAHDPDLPALLEWFRTLIIHFLAQSSLEACSLRFPCEEITFPIMAVDRLSSASPSWSDMEDLISNAMSGSYRPVDPQSVITALKTKIEEASVGCDERGRIIQTFRDIIKQEKQIRIPAALHCEIVLASLCWEQCRKVALKNNDARLQELCEEIGQHSTLISVSRLCCPVSWAFFFGVLEDEDAGIDPILQGSHSILYPVQLPVWLPQNIVENMIKQVQPYLKYELGRMWTEVEYTRKWGRK